MYLPFIMLNAHSINININKLWKWIFGFQKNPGNMLKMFGLMETQNDYNTELIIRLRFINDLLIVIINIIKATHGVTNRK